MTNIKYTFVFPEVKYPFKRDERLQVELIHASSHTVFPQPSPAV